MNIHEYQAKQILKSFSIPLAQGVIISDLSQAQAAIACLPGTVWVVKSQIHAGGRGKGHFKELPANAKGGVRVTFSAAEAFTAVAQMLNKTLITKQTGKAGRKVRRIYIESGVEIARELYLSLLVDRDCGKVCFVASTEGGMDIETVAAQTPNLIHTRAINFSTGCGESDYIFLADALQLSGRTRIQAMELFKNLYRAFIEKDMSLLEINPLVVTPANNLVVLDSKVSFDNNALFRQLDILAYRDISEEDEREIKAAQHDLSYIALDGTIGCMVNGAGLAMATMDIIKLYGGSPANFLDVGGGANIKKVTAAFKIITSDPNVRGILVNIFGGIMRCDIIAEGIVQALSNAGLRVPLVVRLEGTRVAEGRAILKDSGLNVIAADDLDDATQKIIAAVESKT